MRRWSVLFFSVCAVVIAALYGATSAQADAATQIFAAENCFGDRATVRLSWIGVDPGATELSLDLSYQDNGFRAGTFRSSGAMSADLGTVTWDNLPGGRTYFVRLNQTVDGQAQASATYFFKTCSASTAPSTPAPIVQPVSPVSYGDNVDCRYQTCLVDSTYAGTIITVPSLEYCNNHPLECPQRYYYEPMNGQIMVSPNITPSIYAGVTFRNGQFVPNLQGPAGTIRCNDGFFTYGPPSTCAAHGGVTPGQ
jgi:hypothetical protein